MSFEEIERKLSALNRFMDNAYSNAVDMIEELQLQLFKYRAEVLVRRVDELVEQRPFREDLNVPPIHDLCPTCGKRHPGECYPKV